MKKTTLLTLGLAVAMGALAAQGKDVYVSVDFLDEMGLKAYSPVMTADYIRTLVQKHGLDGFFAHESATIETVAGAFEGLRKAFE